MKEATQVLLNVLSEEGIHLFNEVDKNVRDVEEIGKFVRETSMSPRLCSSNEKEPVAEGELKKLNSQLYKTHNFVQSKVASLEKDITDLEFFAKVLRPISTLMRYMKDCLKHPKMIALLQEKSTNPMMMAIALDPSNARETFHNWYDLINGLLGEVFLLNAFATGLLGDKDKLCDMDQLQTDMIVLLGVMQEWEDEM